MEKSLDHFMIQFNLVNDFVKKILIFCIQFLSTFKNLKFYESSLKKFCITKLFFRLYLNNFEGYPSKKRNHVIYFIFLYSNSRTILELF